MNEERRPSTGARGRPVLRARSSGYQVRSSSARRVEGGELSVGARR
ncbi:hypothetical protein [Cellulomonas chitinilytica]|nr:hypothetical protein [Cellulomonas chitinilytica]